MRQRQAVDVSGPVNFNDALKNAGIDGDYSDYLKTQHWTRVRRRTLARRKNCVACNGDGNGQPMHVHHQTYRRLGRELNADVLTMCEKCHAKLHDTLDEKYPGRPVVFKAEKTGEIFPSLFGRTCPKQLIFVDYRDPPKPAIAKKKPANPAPVKSSRISMAYILSDSERSLMLSVLEGTAIKEEDQSPQHASLARILLNHIQDAFKDGANVIVRRPVANQSETDARERLSA